MRPHQRLYVISRADISLGLQAAQAAHAVSQFALDHPDIARQWHRDSNCLVLLSVRSEQELLEYAHMVECEGVAHSLVVEPDIGNEHTALAVAPSPLAPLFSSLPLLGKQVAPA